MPALPLPGRKRAGYALLRPRLLPAAILRQGMQRAGTLHIVPALVSWFYSFLRIPATVPSIAEAKSEGSRDWVGFLSGISRDIVGAYRVHLEARALHTQINRQKTGREPPVSGHRIRSVPCSVHPTVLFLCC